MGKANLIWESIDFEFEDRMTSSTFLRKRSHIEFCIRGFSDRRLGGGESIREIVSCRACVRAVRIPSEIRARNRVSALSLFPFSLRRPSLFPLPPPPPTSISTCADKQSHISQHTSEVGGVSPTGKSFRVVRACAWFGCLVRSGPEIACAPFPFSLFPQEAFPFPFHLPPPNLLSSFSWPYRYYN